MIMTAATKNRMITLADRVVATANRTFSTSEGEVMALSDLLLSLLSELPLMLYRARSITCWPGFHPIDRLEQTAKIMVEDGVGKE